MSALESPKLPLRRELIEDKVSVITVTYNSEDVISNFVESFVKYLDGLIDEIIIVDNASKDKTCAVVSLLRARYPFLKFYPQSQNKGYRIAVNIGISESRNEVLIVTNPDLYLRDDSVKNCYYELIKNENVAIVSGRLLQSRYKYSQYYTHVAIPFLITYPMYDERRKNLPKGSTNVEIGGGPFYFLRRSAFLKVGGFNEHVFMMWEESELSMKLASHGYKILFCPNSVVYHLGSHSIKKFENPQNYFIRVGLPASVFLYYNYCRDSQSKRTIWWLILFYRAFREFLFTKSVAPLGVAYELFSSKPKVKSVEDYGYKWNLRLFLRNELNILVQFAQRNVNY